MLALHLVAAVLVLAFPVWDYREAARLRAAAHPHARAQCYVRSMTVLWLAALAVMALVPFDTLWNATQPMHALSGAVSPEFLQAFLPTVMVGMLLPVLAAFFHGGVRRFLVNQMQDMDYLLPHTRTEIALFAGVSVSAGICEEVLYRGFLLHYLQAAPWHLGPASALLAGSLLFGIAHSGQGVKGLLLTGTIGLFLGALYLLTGNLLLPIAVHILIDLRATAVAYLRTLPQPKAA
jgi:membrane protease YdiL (CAAX protease family)